MSFTKYSKNVLFSAVFLFMLTGFAVAQNDSVSSVKLDTIPAKKKKIKSDIIVYGGANFNDLHTTSEIYKPVAGTGWHAGAMYKRGGFFYWQVGARYNSALYNLLTIDGTDTTHDTFRVTDLDLPLTGGINVLPFLNRLIDLHLFLSAVPAFELSVSENTLGITKDKTNSFNFYGQGGVGLDVFSLLIEAGFNYGFADLLKNAKSNPGQFFINLGVKL
jgi:hypothetical protein